MLTRPSESRPLGKSGISVSPLAWGMWRFKGDDVLAARALVESALDSGISLFDTADIYGADGAGFGTAEALLGRVLADAPELRARMVLATKGGIVLDVPYDSSPSYLESALDASLRRLGVDQVDLWQIHRPDLLANPQETARALERMVQSGKVRAIGVSNFTTPQVSALLAFLSVPLASIQPEFSALRTAPLWDGVVDQAMAHDLAVLAWSPLGGGRLGAADGPVGGLLAAQGGKFGVSAGAAAYSWLMVHPATVIPIVGSQTPARIREACDAFKVEWTRAEWYAVLEASIGERLP
ncbi:MAG: aldo/keto reductase [Candidatus Sphingomonas phytovorans]|nr:aldo/keto reductase [Sphingomonas sp.]WEK00166.1 MAG: aldo/keto reductase [Sphingomonas sp.]